MSDAQGDHTLNQKTVTHTSNWKGKVTNTSNSNFDQKLLRNRTLPVVVPTMNPRIDQRIAPIIVAPQIPHACNKGSCRGRGVGRIVG